jgi:EAL domain-containing protein (putative c-di-GMP-specific phosphodiesterase class I)/GGDEF domain-containing protein
MADNRRLRHHVIDVPDGACMGDIDSPSTAVAAAVPPQRDGKSLTFDGLEMPPGSRMATAGVSGDLAKLSVDVDKAVADAVRTHHVLAVAVLMVDQCEDTLGALEPFRDSLLDQVRARLAERIRPNDMVTRIGSGAFAVVWRDLDTVEQADHLAARLRTSFDDPFEVESGKAILTASIGVSLLEALPSGDDLIESALAAMREAREVGPGQVRISVSSAPVAAWARIRTGAHVLHALELKEFVLHYQPVVDLMTGSVVGVEALVRWQHPRDGMLAPDLFIPVAEATGSVVPLGLWVLETACAQAAAWHAQGLQLHMAVNLSTLQIADPGLLKAVARVLQTTGLDPGMLGFEVTESAVIADADLAVEVLNSLSALGASLSIDDFGTGYSSLVYLKRYPIRALKIDRAFVGGMGVSEEDDAIVASVIALARAVRGTCVAEGIETQEQLAALHALGCRYGQGWLFGKAVPAEELPDLAAQCEQDLIARLSEMPLPGDQRDLAGDRRDHAAGARDHAADLRDRKGNTRDELSDRRDDVGNERDVAGDQRDTMADERDDQGALRDQVADERDVVGEHRDELGQQRDHAGDERDEAADRRDLAGARRDQEGDDRDEAADRRDQVGSLRDQAGDERDRAADERDEVAQQRDGAAAERDRAADARDAEAQRLESSGFGSGMGAVARREAASDRSSALRDREAGASERAAADHDRATAQADRGAGATERSEAEHDRGTATADRGTGSRERTQAESDREAALWDRGSSATERAHAEQDRVTALTDRSAGATERAQAERDRQTASVDRGRGATERGLAERDRARALTDREAGAVERHDADLDRTTALEDRDAASEDRDAAAGGAGSIR